MAFYPIHVFKYALGDSQPPTPDDIPEPNHSIVFREKFRCVYVVKGVWSLLTDLFLKRQTGFKCRMNWEI